MFVLIFIFIFLGMNLLRHIILSLLCFTIAVYCHPVFARQDTNPLLGMIGKEYSDYFSEYETLCDSLFAGDSLSRVKLVRLFTEAAAAAPTDEWELDRRRVEGHVRFYESREDSAICGSGLYSMRRILTVFSNRIMNRHSDTIWKWQPDWTKFRKGNSRGNFICTAPSLISIFLSVNIRMQWSFIER